MVRREVMQNLSHEVETFIEKYLTPVEKIWQPSDFLPDPVEKDFKCCLCPYSRLINEGYVMLEGVL